jgi:uncharacterized membrane protein YedE/YeeE
MDGWTAAIAGGALIGLASGALMLGLGRIAGISGIFGGVMGPITRGWRWEYAFVGGLVIAGAVAVATGLWAPPTRHQSLALVALGGLLVGFGTTLGSGCTSGHGVCGISRLSLRSFVAVVTFMGTGMAVTFVLRHLLEKA